MASSVQRIWKSGARIAVGIALATCSATVLAQSPPPIDFVVGADGLKPASNGNSPISAKPNSPAPLTSTPSFSGLGLGASKPQPGSFPQPDNAPDAVPSKVWTVAGAEKPAGNVAPGQVVRNPRDFGQGWKGFVNQNVLGREMATTSTPAGMPLATLVAPRSTGPRPEWGWHGYESYTVGRHKVSDPVDVSGRANSPEMAPFMKYAHLWRPSNIAGLYPQNSAAPSGVGRTNSPSKLTPAMANEVFKPAHSTEMPMTPSVTTPINDVKPTPVQPTEFRAPPLTGKENIAPLPPLPKVEPAKPKLVYLPPPAETGNRLPQPIREKISAVCTGKCRNLVVELQSPIKMRVAFLVKDQIEADMLINTLSISPELSPYKVDFEVQIGQ